MARRRKGPVLPKNVFDVQKFGARGDGSTDDSAAIQRAFDRLMSNATDGTDRHVLFFPPGVYMVDEPICIPHYDGHAFLKIEIAGGSKYNTVLHQKRYAEKDIFLFENEGSRYVATWTIRNIQFGPCRRAIHIDNAQYAEFVDCSFKGNDWAKDCYGVELDGNSSVWFRGCWWYHTGNAVWAKNGNIRMTDCRFGEDCGGIRVHGGLAMSNCIIDCKDKHADGGYLDMGPASIIVDGTSRFSATGCQFSVRGDSGITADIPSSVLLTGNEFIVSENGAACKTRRLFGSSGVTMTSNMFWFRGDGGSVLESAGNYPIRNSIIKDNRVKLDAGSVASINQTVFDANGDNVVSDNVGDVGFLEAS
jgi:hypothetical protein